MNADITMPEQLKVDVPRQRLVIEIVGDNPAFADEMLRKAVDRINTQRPGGKIVVAARVEPRKRRRILLSEIPNVELHAERVARERREAMREFFTIWWRGTLYVVVGGFLVMNENVRSS